MYLDPSMGGMLLQIVVAIIAASGAIVFGMRRKIVAFFKRGKKEKQVELKDVDVTDVVDMLNDSEAQK
ncbi:MAG: hypothetical protein LBL96_09855 [Clostridiales bacterium]|jgi:hypothetical protein|nr:hypothetical protein [Clostridiales bacterium]